MNGTILSDVPGALVTKGKNLFSGKFPLCSGARAAQELRIPTSLPQVHGVHILSLCSSQHELKYICLQYI